MSSSANPLETPRRALIPILHASHQVVLYNPTSHALSIRERAVTEVKSKPNAVSCPFCQRPYDADIQEENVEGSAEYSESRVHNYFQLLAMVNESSRPATPSLTPPAEPSGIASETMAEGYFAAFFREEHRLGMGAYGSVFLCQVSLRDQICRGLFRFTLLYAACPRWKFLGLASLSSYCGHRYSYACGRSVCGEENCCGTVPRLFIECSARGRCDVHIAATCEICRSQGNQVRLLETMHHPNIITYHHAWLETTRFSSFGPSVPTLL